MKKFLFTMLLAIIGCVTAMAAEPDLLVTLNGESLKVYNLDISVGDKIYYTLEESEDAPVLKINKSDVLVIKKADGTVINLSDNDSSPVHKDKESVKNPDAHEAVTYVATSDFIKDKKGNQIICVEDNKGQKIYFRLVPDEDKTLAVTKWQGKGKYEGEEYILPDYVMENDIIYTVKYVDDQAFYPGSHIDTKYLRKVVFPATLKTISTKAFLGRACLTAIVLPENLEKIGDQAFYRCGTKDDLEQIYIPKSVKSIGTDAFRLSGCNLSPKGYFQGYITSIPDYITTSTCKKYGIDEEAVEAYEKRKR